MKSLNAIVITAMLLFAACSSGGSDQPVPTPAAQKRAETIASTDPMTNKGVGPVKSITLGDLDEVMAAEGEKLFNEKCTACHKTDARYIGPSPAGITSRRSPEWIMNMILNPQGMLESDPIAKQLLAEANGAPMANQNLTEDEARKILEYFRTLN